MSEIEAQSNGSEGDARYIFEQWHRRVVERDLDALMALYAEDAMLETPLAYVVSAAQEMEGCRDERPSGRSSQRPSPSPKTASAAGIAAAVGMLRSARWSGNIREKRRTAIRSTWWRSWTSMRAA